MDENLVRPIRPERIWTAERSDNARRIKAMDGFDQSSFRFNRGRDGEEKSQLLDAPAK
jgi:hypothetical protein